MKKVLLLFVVMLLWSCNNNKNKTPLIDEKEAKKETPYSLTGTWISVNDYIVKDIVITTSDSKTYSFKTTFKDGSIKNESIKINSNGEFHTHNKFGEYYKMRGNSLGIYDEQGLVSIYKK
tara:strand:+ start:58 stop:417 length:360 start_codon:yes stop_codon:yes gene_type:complete